MSFESILFILLYSFLNVILYISFALSLYFSLSEAYLIIIESMVLVLFFGYIEGIYRNIKYESRRKLLKDLLFYKINRRGLRYSQLFSIYTGLFVVLGSIFSAMLNIPLFIEATLLKNVVAGLILIQSTFWVSVYYFVFRYKPDIDESIIEELDASDFDN